MNVPGNPPQRTTEQRIRALEAATASLPRVAYSGSKSGISATSGPTTIVGAPDRGHYLVIVSARVITAGAVGTLAASIAWTDDSQAETRTLFTGFSITAKGETSASALIYVAPSAALTWTVTFTGAVGSPVVNADIFFVRIT